MELFIAPLKDWTVLCHAPKQVELRSFLMFLAEVKSIDLVAVHQVDHRQLGGEASHSGRYSKDLVGRFCQEKMSFGEGQQKQLEVQYVAPNDVIIDETVICKKFYE